MHGAPTSAKLVQNQELKYLLNCVPRAMDSTRDKILTNALSFLECVKMDGAKILLAVTVVDAIKAMRLKKMDSSALVDNSRMQSYQQNKTKKSVFNNLFFSNVTTIVDRQNFSKIE